jgi:hypothetical protein
MLRVLPDFGNCFQRSITLEPRSSEVKKALEKDQCQMTNAERMPNAKGNGAVHG